MKCKEEEKPDFKEVVSTAQMCINEFKTWSNQIEATYKTELPKVSLLVSDFVDHLETVRSFVLMARNQVYSIQRLIVAGPKDTKQILELVKNYQSEIYKLERNFRSLMFRARDLVAETNTLPRKICGSFLVLASLFVASFITVMHFPIETLLFFVKPAVDTVSSVVSAISWTSCLTRLEKVCNFVKERSSEGFVKMVDLNEIFDDAEKFAFAISTVQAVPHTNPAIILEDTESFNTSLQNAYSQLQDIVNLITQFFLALNHLLSL